MTVKQLREALSKYPDNMDVFMAERKTEFTYGLVNSARIDRISFSEEPGSDPLATEEVVVLDEE